MTEHQGYFVSYIAVGRGRTEYGDSIATIIKPRGSLLTELDIEDFRNQIKEVTPDMTIVILNIVRIQPSS